MDVPKSIGFLAKYIPFLDYIVDKIEHKHKEKYDTMRKWIKNEKKFSRDYTEKIEKSIVVAYKELSNIKDFPFELHKLFTVDLCSDDEDVGAKPSKSVTKPSNNTDVTVISEDEDDVQLVADGPKSKTNSNISQGSSNIPALRKNQNRINNEILERISKVVTVVVNDEKDTIMPSPPSNPIIPAVENKIVKVSTLPVDENNKPIFFRRSDLPITIADADKHKNLEKEHFNPSSPKKKKKKHKKEKRHKKDKEKSSKKKKHMHVIVDLSSDSDEPQVAGTADRSLETLTGPFKAQKLTFTEPSKKVVEQTEEPNRTSALNNLDDANFDGKRKKLLESSEKPSKETQQTKHAELQEKSVSELVALKKSLLEKVGIHWDDDDNDNFLNINVQDEIPIQSKPTVTATLENRVKIPTPSIQTYELGENNELIPECQRKSLRPDIQNAIWPAQQCLIQSNTMQFNVALPVLASPAVQLLQNPLPSLPKPVPPPVLPTPVPMAVTPPLLLPSPPLSVTTSSRDPRLQKLLTQGQYGQSRISTGPSTPPIIPSTEILQQLLPNRVAVMPTSLPISSHPAPWTFSSHGQYPVNSVPSHMVQIPATNIWPAPQQAAVVAASTKGFTKSNTTYGEHRRQYQEAMQLLKEQEEKERLLKAKAEKEAKQREEEERLKKEKAAEEAKLLEEKEARICTETIRQILSKHETEIVDKLTNSNKTTDDNKKCRKSPLKQPSTVNDEPTRKNGPNSRMYKELECSFKGFDTMQDFLPTTIDGKRRCSISARKAIAENLGLQVERTNTTATRSESLNAQKRLSSSPNESVSNKRPKISLTSDNKLSIKLKRCKVVLTRMSKTEILNLIQPKNKKKTSYARKSTQNKRINQNHQLKQIQEKHNNESKHVNSAVNKTVNKTLTEPERKNIDCCMTERNSKICVLCDKRPGNLTNHFIHFHKQESFVSRLTWEELDELQLKVPYAVEVITKASDPHVKTFRVDCPFCPSDSSNKIASFANLRRHYSTHTGEYAYMCKGCSLKRPFRDEIKQHQERKKCANTGVMELYRYLNSTIIYMYLCNICNFVQLNKANVFKHLREQHGKIKEDPTYVKELTLAAIKEDDGSVERVPMSTIPNELMQVPLRNERELRELEHNTTDIEKICVTNEALIDDNVAGIIKTEPEFNFSINEELNTNFETNSNDQDEFEKNDSNNSSSLPAKSDIIETTISTAEDEIDLKPDMAFFESLLSSADMAACITSDLLSVKTKTEILENVEKKPDPEVLLLESVKALLRKYTADTGIRPELLHKCPIINCNGFFPRFSLWLSHMKAHHNALIANCPHCKMKTELPVEDFEEHFKTHCVRCYLCFYCDISCIDENEIKAHVKAKHSEILQQRIERIPYNMTYTFYIMIEQNFLTDRLEFLMKLNDLYKIRVQNMNKIAIESESLNTKWPVSGNPHWLENLQLPIFRSNISTSNCLLRACNQSFNTQDELLDHLLDHNVTSDRPFHCEICKCRINSLSWKSLVEHMYLHSERIFLCCVCSYYACDRRNMLKHICQMHDRRDVPLIRLHRCEKKIEFELEFIFAAGMRTFTTTKSCFCGCGANDLSVDTFVSHLRREHKLKLHYFCEYCNEYLPQLQLSEEHHGSKHTEFKSFKIRCQIALEKERQVTIVSTLPLKIRLNDEQYNNSSQVSIGINLPCEKTVVNEISIKKETDENDIILMEEDEVVAENEVKRVQNSNLGNGNRPSITCKQFLQLNSNLF